MIHNQKKNRGWGTRSMPVTCFPDAKMLKFFSPQPLLSGLSKRRRDAGVSTRIKWHNRRRRVMTHENMCQQETGDESLPPPHHHPLLLPIGSDFGSTGCESRPALREPGIRKRWRCFVVQEEGEPNSSHTHRLTYKDMNQTSTWLCIEMLIPQNISPSPPSSSGCGDVLWHRPRIC